MTERVVDRQRTLQPIDISVRRDAKPRRWPFPLEVNFLGLYKHVRAGIIHDEGTHIDDVQHMNKRGRKLTEADINKFNGPCLIIDYTGKPKELDAIPDGTERVIIRSIPSPRGRRGRLLAPALDVRGAEILREKGVQAAGITRQHGIGDRATHLVLHGNGTTENQAIIIMEDINLPPEAKAMHVYSLNVTPRSPLAEVDPRQDAILVNASLFLPSEAKETLSIAGL